MLPEIVGERDLASANATESVVENLSVVVGPAIGAGLLVLGTPTFAFVHQRRDVPRLRRHSPHRCVRTQPRVGEGRTRPNECWTSHLGRGFRELAASADARVLGGFMLGTAFIYGIQTVVLVLVAGAAARGGSRRRRVFLRRARARRGDRRGDREPAGALGAARRGALRLPAADHGADGVARRDRVRRAGVHARACARASARSCSTCSR